MAYLPRRDLFNLLRKVNVRDNGEELVDLRGILKGADFAGRGKAFLRQVAALKLSEAASFLPPGYRLRIKSAWRTRAQESEVWERFYERIRRQYLRLSQTKVKAMTNELCPPLQGAITPFHLTGGAVDLTLISPAGREVEMVNRKGDWLKEAETNYLKLHRPIRRNRKLLIGAMTRAGFVSHPKKWWHFSYGDHLWALLKNKPAALYGPQPEGEPSSSQLPLLEG